MKKIRVNSKFLREISACAESFSLPVYLVGGGVRDLLLGKSVLDLDIVSVGSPSELVKRLAAKWKAKVRHHERFKTFVVTFPGGRHIDFATAREETYSSPGSLPKVLGSSLPYDVKRRDFAINALALSLNKKDFGEIVDLVGGLKDLKEKKLRILHGKSFADDPTRMLRLARFASRGFSIAASTEKSVVKHRKYIAKVSDERISAEILEILEEPRPSRAFALLRKWKLFEDVLSGVDYKRMIGRIDRAGSLENRLALLFNGMSKLQSRVLLEKLKLRRELRKSIEKKLKNETKQILNGNDLIKMGYEPGPLFKRIFEETKKHKFSSRKKAVQFVFDNFPQKR